MSDAAMLELVLGMNQAAAATSAVARSDRPTASLFFKTILYHRPDLFPKEVTPFMATLVPQVLSDLILDPSVSTQQARESILAVQKASERKSSLPGLSSQTVMRMMRANHPVDQRFVMCVVLLSRRETVTHLVDVVANISGNRSEEEIFKVLDACLDARPCPPAQSLKALRHVCRNRLANAIVAKHLIQRSPIQPVLAVLTHRESIRNLPSLCSKESIAVLQRQALREEAANSGTEVRSSTRKI